MQRIIRGLPVTLMMIIIICGVVSCRPRSKEAYLEKYSQFMKEVSEKSINYSDDDWKKADEKYKKFNEDWYAHFKDDLTFKEKLTTTKYSVQYTYYKSKPEVIDLYNTYVKEDYEKLKEKIKFYRENNMDEDIESLLKKAKEAGDTSVKVIQEMIKDVDIELKNK
jgi:hypothetical protein